MPSLADSQSRFMTCLQKGPDHLPLDLFVEDAERALMGMKAHANTVSHARLVALENAYPKLHGHMGHERFHALSRDYIDQDHILTCDMNDIAADFARFLTDHKKSATEIDLAHIEWAWLESYYSAEAEPVALTDIAALGEADLLAFPIDVHPAIRLISLTGTLSPQLSELGTETPFALMVARPEAQVLFHPLNPTEYAIAKKVANICTMGNLLDAAIELDGETHAMTHLIKLIQTGMITKTNNNGDE